MTNLGKVRFIELWEGHEQRDGNPTLLGVKRKCMLKGILKKLLMQFIGKKLGIFPKRRYPKYKYYKPKKNKGLYYKLKKVFD